MKKGSSRKEEDRPESAARAARRAAARVTSAMDVGTSCLTAWGQEGCRREGRRSMLKREGGDGIGRKGWEVWNWGENWGGRKAIEAKEGGRRMLKRGRGRNRQEGT